MTAEAPGTGKFGPSAAGGEGVGPGVGDDWGLEPPV